MLRMREKKGGGGEGKDAKTDFYLLCCDNSKLKLL